MTDVMTDEEFRSGMLQGPCWDPAKRMTAEQFQRYVVAEVICGVMEAVASRVGDRFEYYLVVGHERFPLVFTESDPPASYKVQARQVLEQVRTSLRHGHHLRMEEKSRAERSNRGLEGNSATLVTPSEWQPVPAGVFAQLPNRNAVSAPASPRAALTDAQVVERYLEGIEDRRERETKRSELELALEEPELCRGTLADVHSAVLGDYSIGSTTVDGGAARTFFGEVDPAASDKRELRLESSLRRAELRAGRLLLLAVGLLFALVLTVLWGASR